MKAMRISKVQSGQDYTIFGDYLFAFIDRDERGNCAVYEMKTLLESGGVEPEPISRFKLDKRDLISTHNNAVFFGNEYYEEGDEFPLLYSNVYNNYQKCERRYEGVLCAYRLKREGSEFSTKLVQVIEIGFVEDTSLWKSAPGTFDIRPYGNFTMDKETGELYAFVMRDATNTTRYFAFDMPKVSEGALDEVLGVKKVVLTPADIKYSFDCEYHKGIQGACCHGGKIYSVEGGCCGHTSTAALRIINPKKKEQERYISFVDHSIREEPEGIDFYGEDCYYVAGHGDMYLLEF